MSVRSICLAAVMGALPVAALAQPDLVPDVSQLTTNGTLKVVNQGKKPAGATVATIVCHKQGGGGCAEAPGMAAYENAAYPNAVTIPVPPIPPGKSYSHTLSFWNALDWQPGTYSLAVKVDAGSAVAESIETNNAKVAQKTVLPNSVGIPPAKVGGFAANSSGKARPPAPSGAIAAGLPDITKTSLGFAINGFTEWGGSTTIDQPNQVRATKAGPAKNMCVINTGLYRTFNMGNVAAGSFIDILYRNGTPVYTRNVPSLAAKKSINFENHELLFQEGMNVIRVKMDANNNVSESHEGNNVFEVKVMVQVDCNGDGVVPGKPRITSPSRPKATPAKIQPRRTQ